MLSFNCPSLKLCIAEKMLSFVLSLLYYMLEKSWSLFHSFKCTADPTTVWCVRDLKALHMALISLPNPSKTVKHLYSCWLRHIEKVLSWQWTNQCFLQLISRNSKPQSHSIKGPFKLLPVHEELQQTLISTPIIKLVVLLATLGL